jgi:hypothetical protein
MLMTKTFWKQAGEKAAIAAAAAALAMLTAGTVDVFATDWVHVGSIALGAGIFSVLASITIPTPEVRTIRKEAVRLATLAAVSPKKAPAEVRAKK